MIHILIPIGTGIVGLVCGALWHKAMAGEAAITKTEISGWAQRLRLAITADAVTAKNTISGLIADVEKKL